MGTGNQTHRPPVSIFNFSRPDNVKHLSYAFSPATGMSSWLNVSSLLQFLIKVFFFSFFFSETGFLCVALAVLELTL